MLTAFTLSCIQSLKFPSSCKTETLYPLNNSPSPPPPTLGNHPSTLCLCGPVSYISGITQHMSLCDWLVSLNKMSSRFIHVVACVRIAFLFKGEQYYSVWIDHIGLSVHSPVGTWVSPSGCCV